MAKKQARGITKSEILEAGMSLFLSKGAGVTVKDVATAANVSRQMVYQYFKTRGGLLLALARQIDDQSGIKDRFHDATQIANPEQRVAACVNVWLSYVQEIQVLANELNRSRRADPDAQATYTDRVNATKASIRELICSLRQSGTLRDKVQVDEATDVVFAVMSPQIYELLHVDQSWSHQKTCQHTVDLVSNFLLDKETLC